MYVTMTYDIIDGPLPAGWKEVKAVWFDANQCGTSEVKPLKEDGAFTVTSKPWTPNFDGDIIGVGGHLHDGGVDVQIMSSTDAKACTSVAKYGESPEYVFKATMRMGAGMNYAEKHISSMSQCYSSSPTLATKKLARSQVWVLKANYDYSKFAGNKGENGKQEGIMAIAIMYVAVPAAGAAPKGGR